MAYLGFGCVYLHAAGLWLAHQIAGNPEKAWAAYVGAGDSLVEDVGWVVPTAVASILAAYVALFGETVIRRGLGRATRDFAIVACLAIASSLLGYSTTTSLALFTHGNEASRAFPLIGFTLFAVLLAAKAATAFWGSPARQLRVAVNDLADMRMMRARLRLPDISAKARRTALVAWTVLPPLVFLTTVPSAGNSAPTTYFLGGAALVDFPFIVWALVYFARSDAISRKPLNRSLNILVLILSVLIGLVLSAPLWIFSNGLGRSVLVVLVMLIVAAVVVSPGWSFALGPMARDLAYARLSKRIPKAASQAEHARIRLGIDSGSPAQARTQAPTSTAGYCSTPKPANSSKSLSPRQSSSRSKSASSTARSTPTAVRSGAPTTDFGTSWSPKTPTSRTARPKTSAHR
jgi:hypothetical protein